MSNGGRRNGNGQTPPTEPDAGKAAELSK
jgi:hypothetical protein